MGWPKQRLVESLDYLTRSNSYLDLWDPMANQKREASLFDSLFGQPKVEPKRLPLELWHVTAYGYRRVAEMRRKRTDPVERVSALRQQLLTWAYEKERGGESFSWNSFVEADHSFCGVDRFSREEVERQIRYLKSRELLDSTHMNDLEEESGDRPALTGDGVDCVLNHGGEVGTFMKQRPRSDRSNPKGSVHISDMRGNVNVHGENVRQAITTGVNTVELLRFVGAVNQTIRVIPLPKYEQDEIRGKAEELYVEAEKPKPDVNKLERLWSAVMEGLAKAAPTVAGTMLTDLGEEAMKAISS
jgi:hypothetical protein